jgi:hypothetical protein
VTHETIELMRQRIFTIALGYPDANDARELSNDPIHKLAVGRDPVQGGSSASQPTLSRFENGAGRVDLFRLASGSRAGTCRLDAAGLSSDCCSWGAGNGPRIA